MKWRNHKYDMMTTNVQHSEASVTATPGSAGS